MYSDFQLPKHGEDDKLLDVLVFIHGGAFMFLEGSGYRPDYILDKDIVLVTFNYRLGPIGTMWRIIINIFLLILSESVDTSIRRRCIRSCTLVMPRECNAPDSTIINSKRTFQTNRKNNNTSPYSWQSNQISKINRLSAFSVIMIFTWTDSMKFSAKTLKFNY